MTCRMTLYFWALALSFCAFAGAQAEESDPLIGNYEVTWEGLDGTPPVVLQVYRNDKGVLVADLDSTTVAYDYTTKPVVRSGGGYEVNWGLYANGEQGSILRSQLVTVDHNTLVGTYETTEGETGREVWRRTRPEVEEVQVVEQSELNSWGIWRGYTYDARLGSGRKFGLKHPVGGPVVLKAPYDPTANVSKMPKVFLFLYGRDLWGQQDIRVAEGLGLQIFESKWLICRPASETGAFVMPAAGSCLGEEGIQGRAISLAVGPEAKSGPAHLLFNNQIIPFELQIEGRPAVAESLPEITISSLKVDVVQAQDRLLDMRKARTKSQKAYEAADRSATRVHEDWLTRFEEFKADVGAAQASLDAAKATAQADLDAGLKESAAIDALHVAQGDFDRRVKLYEGRMNDASDQLAEATLEADRAGALYAEMRQAGVAAEWRATRDVVKVSLLPGFTARYDPEYLAARQELDQNIELLEAALVRAEEAREVARRNMLVQDQIVTEAMERFVLGARASIALQTLVELGIQIDEGRDAGKGGPYAFLAWAGQRIYKNMYEPPKIYEPDFDLKSTPLSAKAVLGEYDLRDEKIQENARQFTNKVYWEKAMLGMGREGFSRFQMEKIMTGYIRDRMDMPVGSADYKSMTKLIEDQYASLRKADTSYRAKNLQSGKAAFAKEWGLSLTKDLAKAEASARTKQLIAEVFEGKAWTDYAAAQADFYGAVRHFKFAGNVYWKNRDMLEGLKAMRSALSDIESQNVKGWVYSSEPMTLRPNMPVWVFITGTQNPDELGVDDSYYDAPLQLTVNGVALPRLAGSNHFMVSAEAIDALMNTDLDHAVFVVTK